MINGIYLHVPFCVKRCYYCDFNTYTLDRAAVETYLEAVGLEINLWVRRLEEEGFDGRFDTVFIGGGTPTCLSGKDLTTLITRIKDAFPVADDAEITCEANPGSSNADKFEALFNAGVNRLSIGAQSMDDGLLEAIGRTHTADDVRTTVTAARKVGYDNVSLDLIFALPNQTLDQWQRTLTEIVQMKPDHLSCYSLIIEEGTPFGDAFSRGELPVVGEDLEAEMFQLTIDMLRGAGYDHYEISNFALHGKRSKHNQIYWDIGRYIGLGPGAHGFWGNRRYVNTLLPATYAETLKQGKTPDTTTAIVERDMEMADVVLFGLRMTDGISERSFKGRFGTTVREAFPEEVRRLATEGLIEANGETIKLTSKGLPLANLVFGEFVRM